MSNQSFSASSRGEKITTDASGALYVPKHPIIPFIEGDGIGVDITPVMKKVVDAAVHQAYEGECRIVWKQVYAGAKAVEVCDVLNGLPEETMSVIKEHKVAIKGPLMTPVGGGIRSLNVALRQYLDLYVCLRPVRYFEGVPSPLKDPAKVDMVILRENSEDIYAGIEWEARSPQVEKLIIYLRDELGVSNIRFPNSSAIGIKPISEEGSVRLVRRAIQYAIDHKRDSVTLVHKGNIMKFTEGAFKNWGYQVARDEFSATPLDGGPWHMIDRNQYGHRIIIKDVIADAFLQQILMRPEEYSVIATMNLNGDYISDALAAEVGGIGIAPGANLSDTVALFEATHGTAPKYAGQDKVNPGSLILSAEMMLRHMGWNEAADLIIQGMQKTIAQKIVTYDFARLMIDAEAVSCSKFGEAIVSNMN